MNIRGSTVLLVAYFFHCALLATSKSYYSIIAPGLIKSNHNYTISVSLHEADEPAVINVRVQGPFYYSALDVHLQPYETKAISFVLPKLTKGEHKLIAEGVSGIEFRNESRLNVDILAGPKIYIQTDKAVYKPGDIVQFRCVLLDEHTRPLFVKEPIRVEIFDGNENRVKQFKDISLQMGIYIGKFEISKYPVIGKWKIKVIISGKYDFSNSKTINIRNYVLPKFSVYLETQNYFIPDDGLIKLNAYGKYTFDKYVEGELTIKVWDYSEEKLLLQKKSNINETVNLELHIDKSKVDWREIYGLIVKAELKEKLTGSTQASSKSLPLRNQHYNIDVDSESIRYRYHQPYELTAHVRPYNASIKLDRETPVIMKHGSKEYKAYLNEMGDAVFKFEHDRKANHVFRYKDSSYKMPNIYTDEEHIKNETLSYCNLRVKGDRPRLGTKLEIEVTSIAPIPYINYVVVGHANIVKADHIELPPDQKSYTLEITPSIEMVPMSFLYVYYVQDGNLRYQEISFSFPREFENKVSIVAPKKVGPGQNITIDLKAQPKSLVALMAVDLAVFLLDSSYDLQRPEILQHLNEDRTYLPFCAEVYPGLLSGVITMTNANYLFISKLPDPLSKAASVGPWIFRKKFPETWIFDNYEISQETTSLALTVPDTITTWRLTAFTVNNVTGFGIVDGPTDIISIQNSFIVLNLPYSVKRGEIVAIPVIVYNYHNVSIEAEIILYNMDQDFYFLESSLLQNSETGSDENRRIKRETIPPNGSGKVEFLINPKRVGKLKLQVTAENALSRDAVIQELKVEPEGIVKRDTKAIYARLSTNGIFEHTFEVNFPQDIVVDSEFITLTAGGDSLVPTLENLNKLVLLPTGCGEQNMVNFAPNILVLEYLKASGNYFKQRSLVAKAKKFIEIGFQQQLSYRHSNGGYSVFGTTDKEPSTWLTAYVIRFFVKVSPYLSIQPHIVSSGLNYLASNQLKGGDFAFTGYLFYPAQQNRYGFTAFVLMTFLESPKLASKYQSVIQRGLTFLNSNLDNITDTYALSIVATALQMAKHENAQQIVQKLLENKKQSDLHFWWSQDDANREKDVEITAYVLMSLLHTDNDPTDDLKILKWLVDQRNAQGGFKSTHDTVVGLQALVKFSQKYANAKNINMKIKYSAKNQNKELLNSGDMVVDANNMLVLQTEELPSSTRFVDIKITGSGYSLMQLSSQYNVATDESLKHFQIQPKPQILNEEEMLLEICFDYMLQIGDDPGSTSNMIIMEANLPSGFTTNPETSNELLENEIIQRIESKNEETTLVIYFEKLMPNNEHCLNILGDKVIDVLKRKPAAISLYDYYNISRHDTAFYNV